MWWCQKALLGVQNCKCTNWTHIWTSTLPACIPSVQCTANIRPRRLQPSGKVGLKLLQQKKSLDRITEMKKIWHATAGQLSIAAPNNPCQSHRHLEVGHPKQQPCQGGLAKRLAKMALQWNRCHNAQFRECDCCLCAARKSIKLLSSKSKLCLKVCVGCQAPVAH